LRGLLAPGQLNVKGFIHTIFSSGSTDPQDVTLLSHDGSRVEVLLWGRLIHIPTGPMFQIIVSAHETPEPPQKKK
jgi:hypothetical protein